MYFSKEYISFFEELAGNNTREWFQENKQRYIEHVKAPFQVFLKDLMGEISRDDGLIMTDISKAMFRINRDIRFSRDKSPYKLHMAGVVSRGGRKDMTQPGLYVHAGWDGFFLACGAYQPSKEHLEAIRLTIIKNQAKVNAILANETLRNCFGQLSGEKNKILPQMVKQYAQEHPLIYFKQYHFYKKYPHATLFKKDLLAFTLGHWFAAKPRNRFLAEAMGGA